MESKRKALPRAWSLQATATALPRCTNDFRGGVQTQSIEQRAERNETGRRMPRREGRREWNKTVMGRAVIGELVIGYKQS